jgi:hypothetical protein
VFLLRIATCNGLEQTDLRVFEQIGNGKRRYGRVEFSIGAKSPMRFLRTDFFLEVGIAASWDSPRTPELPRSLQQSLPCLMSIYVGRNPSSGVHRRLGGVFWCGFSMAI